MRSIMQEDPDICYLCGKTVGATPYGYMDQLEWHHVFEGNPDRKLSEKYGLKVKLHGITCHREGAESVHKNRGVYMALMAAGQKAFEREHAAGKILLGSSVKIIYSCTTQRITIVTVKKHTAGSGPRRKEKV